MHWRFAAIVTVLTFAAAPAAVSASTIVFSNLGSGSIGGWAISGPTSSLGNQFEQGSSFTVGGDYMLDSVTVKIGYVAGTNAVNLWLMSDSLGLPGTLIESFVLTNLGPAIGSATALVTVTSILQPLLTSGTQYFLVASASGDAHLDWSANTTGDIGITRRINGGAWQTDPFAAVAFEVSATPVVPEPASLTLLGLGLAGLVARRRRERGRRPTPSQEGTR